MSDSHRYFFVHTLSLESWEVAEPIRWCLENAHEPILERANERLVQLTLSDKERIIRLVTRRCKLNLIEVRPARVVVHYWGKDGLADLRPFFKRHCLARNGIEVFLIERKHEVITVTAGSECLYGTELGENFPWDLFSSKWQKRETEEADDWQPVPSCWSSGFCWQGVEPNRIPWAALKSVWTLEKAASCSNCDGPTILVNFGLVPTGLLNRKANFIRICPLCRRWFQDSIKDVAGWIMAHVEAQLHPGFELIMGKPRPWPPSKR